jgi:uncharacterized membrane protein YccF (DUF307 family)
MFVFGPPSTRAVIINYMNQNEARGTFLESHFRWPSRSVWFAALWIVIAFLRAITIIGIPFAWALAIRSRSTDGCSRVPIRRKRQTYGIQGTMFPEP